MPTLLNPTPAKLAEMHRELKDKLEIALFYAQPAVHVETDKFSVRFVYQFEPVDRQGFEWHAEYRRDNAALQKWFHDVDDEINRAFLDSNLHTWIDMTCDDYPTEFAEAAKRLEDTLPLFP